MATKTTANSDGQSPPTVGNSTQGANTHGNLGHSSLDSRSLQERHISSCITLTFHPLLKPSVLYAYKYRNTLYGKYSSP